MNVPRGKLDIPKVDFTCWMEIASSVMCDPQLESVRCDVSRITQKQAIGSWSLSSKRRLAWHQPSQVFEYRFLLLMSNFFFSKIRAQKFKYSQLWLNPTWLIQKSANPDENCQSPVAIPEIFNPNKNTLGTKRYGFTTIDCTVLYLKICFCMTRLTCHIHRGCRVIL